MTQITLTDSKSGTEVRPGRVDAILRCGPGSGPGAAGASRLPFPGTRCGRQWWSSSTRAAPAAPTEAATARAAEARPATVTESPPTRRGRRSTLSAGKLGKRNCAGPGPGWERPGPQGRTVDSRARRAYCASSRTARACRRWPQIAGKQWSGRPAAYGGAAVRRTRMMSESAGRLSRALPEPAGRQ
jgi:hypothetical protein